MIKLFPRFRFFSCFFLFSFSLSFLSLFPFFFSSFFRERGHFFLLSPFSSVPPFRFPLLSPLSFQSIYKKNEQSSRTTQVNHYLLRPTITNESKTFVELNILLTDFIDDADLVVFIFVFYFVFIYL